MCTGIALSVAAGLLGASAAQWKKESVGDRNISSRKLLWICNCPYHHICNQYEVNLMAQLLLHATLHATIYEVDWLKVGGGQQGVILIQRFSFIDFSCSISSSCTFQLLAYVEVG